MKHTCCYVLSPTNQDRGAVYCEKPVGFKMVTDDDGNKQRKYNAFCDEHQRIVDETVEDDDYAV